MNTIEEMVHPMVAEAQAEAEAKIEKIQEELQEKQERVEVLEEELDNSNGSITEQKRLLEELKDKKDLTLDVLTQELKDARLSSWGRDWNILEEFAEVLGSIKPEVEEKIIKEEVLPFAFETTIKKIISLLETLIK